MVRGGGEEQNFQSFFLGGTLVSGLVQCQTNFNPFLTLKDMIAAWTYYA